MQHLTCNKGICSVLTNIQALPPRDPSWRRIPLLVWNGLRERAPDIAEFR